MSLTIKQAFAALSDACANGMKNPFFVMRRLKESFADVADKVVDASGDKVTVTQTLTEGTQIGSIKVNNDTTVLYAPASSSLPDYSTTEYDTGRKWIDGKSIYQKTVNFESLTNSQTKTVAHNIANIENVINYFGFATNPTTSDTIQLVYTEGVDKVSLIVSNTNIIAYIAGNFSGFTSCYVTIQYTKTES